MRHRRLTALFSASALALALSIPVSAFQATGAQTLVIGVDHVDPANQIDHGVGNFTPGRVFEYTDFFTRDVTVHRGDTLNFRTAPNSFHVIALSANEPLARQVYPIAFTDGDDPSAPGSGAARIALGPSNFPILNGSLSNPNGPGTIIDFTRPAGPPDCGVPALGEPVCTFRGGDDVEVAGANFNVGPNAPPADWNIQIDAPPGTYHYFCYLHPDMTGTLEVVAPGAPVTSQQQIDARSIGQFASDRTQALDAEAAANVVSFTGGAPGTRTYDVHVGLTTSKGKVAILEMLPSQPLTLAPGDRVHYLWGAEEIHSVTFPAWSPGEPGPFNPDCGPPDTFFFFPPGLPFPICGDTPNVPEVVLDLGNARPGILADPGAVVDSGVLAGAAYGIQPSAQDWSAVASAPGTYHFQCILHDFMQGSIVVTS